MPWTTERKKYTHTYGTEKWPSDCLEASKIEFCTKETWQILNSSQTKVWSLGSYSDSRKLEELLCFWAIPAGISTPFSPIDSTYPERNSCTVIVLSEGYMQPFLPITVLHRSRSACISLSQWILCGYILQNKASNPEGSLLSRLYQ